MEMTKIKAGQALAQVLVDWNIDHIYGITADSINNTVDGFYQEKDHLKYIQVRHEEVGALAAAADAKLTGTIGVSFGSAGPGAVHLLNGLYDAKMDHVPVLALVGQSATSIMNTNFFQEMNQDPIFADVAEFHKQVTTAEQIPYVVDEAIRSAYATRSVSVVIIPDDLSGQDIKFDGFKTASLSGSQQVLMPKLDDVQQTIAALKAAQHPVLWIGKGAYNARQEVIAVSEKFSLPVLSTAPATGIMPTDHPNFMGSRGRLGTKPAFEVSQAADLVLFVGTNFPFARYLPQGIKFIQVNNNLADLGKQHDADITVLADAKEFFQALLQSEVTIKPTKFLKTAQRDKQNWNRWLKTIATDDQGGLTAEGVLEAIKDNATDDAVFGLDVGNNTEWAIRQLPLNKQQTFTMSAWYGTMGFGLPAGLAAQLNYPKKQVWSISGDGGYAMVMPDLLTEVKYHLPVINVVLENKVLGFIQHEKLLANQAPYGIDLIGADWAKMADNMGAIGFKVTNLKELKATFQKVTQLQQNGNQLPIVIDAKIKNVDPIDTSFVPVDPENFDADTIAKYRERYGIAEADQPALSQLLNEL
ncbi:thiamine pyrophosphate-dependent enzyme [Lactiplantibacillus plantarum]|uniref:thiamine pyrophosphate-dependent enzyme n=1 Tax=Lactiplantibacillus plantarum TaxID=1590 RepID=UPI0029A6FEC0|nr:thiamine pyrophosphate-dependent enzyme [Lactiplantibacillus plantarum]MDX3786125.1 thiamine pyrophosphate-binding protein [Lactiplantibacillus plantarum]MDX3811652.1 thiamine pyrophosphate-binding protein [Lactiplantibacillus plantarum]MDX3857199.1 thiamine pyrophosphate-binding protein [Lactiplantibacillus plantarum]